MVDIQSRTIANALGRGLQNAEGWNTGEFKAEEGSKSSRKEGYQMF